MKYTVAAFALSVSSCASAPEGVLAPSNAVARQGAELMWWEENATDPDLLEIVPPRFEASVAHTPQAARAFGALSNHFPNCPIPARFGYATWARPGSVLVLFELRRSTGCPTTPLVSVDDTGGVVVIVTPDQAVMFD
jgi:hypothetical protein